MHWGIARAELVSANSHADLLEAGAIGQDGEQMPSTNLLIVLFMLGEMGQAPVLIAPRDASLQGGDVEGEEPSGQGGRQTCDR